MKTWLIYEPPGGGERTLDGAAAFVTVREGFSKGAFLFPSVWLIWRRCWAALALYAVAAAAAIAAASLLDIGGGLGVLLMLLPNVAVGFEQAWLRARSLERRGYRFAGSVLARTREEAEALFFSEWLAEGAQRRIEPRETASAPYRPAQSGVLGMFPQAGPAR